MKLSKIFKLKDELEENIMKMMYKFENKTGIICHQITMYYDGENRGIYIRTGDDKK